MNQTISQTRRFRMKKEDSAFLYCLLEAEGDLFFYSTVKHVTGDPYRDVDVSYPTLRRNDAVESLEKIGNSILSLEEVFLKTG